jgi:hypothetical protein
MAGDFGDLPRRQIAVDILVSCWFLAFGQFPRKYPQRLGLHIAALQFFPSSAIGFSNREMSSWPCVLLKDSSMVAGLTACRGILHAAGVTGSSERQIYQIATLQYGARLRATSRASLRRTRLAREIVLADAVDETDVQRQHVGSCQVESGTSPPSSVQCHECDNSAMIASSSRPNPSHARPRIEMNGEVHKVLHLARTQTNGTHVIHFELEDFRRGSSP